MIRFPASASLVLGAIAATGFAPLDLWPLMLVAIAAWLWLVHAAPSLRSALWRGWVFGVGHFTVNNNWCQHAFDFQDAMQGPATYDLASFCVDRDSQRFVGPDREALLLEAYRDALERRNTDLYPDPRALARDFQRCVAFRALRVIGRFRELAAEEGKDRYLHYIPAMARRARTALEACGDDALVDVLAARSEDFA